MLTFPNMRSIQNWKMQMIYHCPAALSIFISKTNNSNANLESFVKHNVRYNYKCVSRSSKELNGGCGACPDCVSSEQLSSVLGGVEGWEGGNLCFLGGAILRQAD